MRYNQANRCWRRRLRMGKQGEALNPFPTHTHYTHSATLYHEVWQPLHVSWSASPPVRGWWAHRKLRPSQLSSPGTCPHAPSHACSSTPPAIQPHTHALPTPIHPPHPIYHTDSVGEDSVFLPACLPARTYAAALSSSYPSRRLGTKQPDRHATPPPPHHHQQQ